METLECSLGPASSSRPVCVLWGSQSAGLPGLIPSEAEAKAQQGVSRGGGFEPRCVPSPHPPAGTQGLSQKVGGWVWWDTPDARPCAPELCDWDLGWSLWLLLWASEGGWLRTPGSHSHSARGALRGRLASPGPLGAEIWGNLLHVHLRVTPHWAGGHRQADFFLRLWPGAVLGKQVGQRWAPDQPVCGRISLRTTSASRRGPTGGQEGACGRRSSLGRVPGSGDQAESGHMKPGLCWVRKGSTETSSCRAFQWILGVCCCLGGVHSYSAERIPDGWLALGVASPLPLLFEAFLPWLRPVLASLCTRLAVFVAGKVLLRGLAFFYLVGPHGGGDIVGARGRGLASGVGVVEGPRRCVPGGSHWAPSFP